MLRLEFEIAEPGPVAVGIYDVGGRFVRSIVSGSRMAGRHEATWDGRNERGRPVAGGTYLLRLEAGGAFDSAPVTLLR